MHTQTESAHEHPAGPAPWFPAATGLGLYFLTLAGEVVLGVGVRWLLTYIGASALGVIAPLGPSAELLACLVAFAPLASSVLSLLAPGPGIFWRWRLGARRPTLEESTAIDAALAQLRVPCTGGIARLRFYVLDHPLPGAAVRGRCLLLHRPLFESACLAAVLAHELGHAGSLDGRLTEALARLRLWAGPLRPAGRSREVATDGDPLLGPVRWSLRLAGGGATEDLLWPLWATYWRSREYAADSHAAGLGQAEDLARHLADFHLPLDAPQRRRFFNRAAHPPIAHRIERLRAY
jgi:Zn-dependent protease with chaperone function